MNLTPTQKGWERIGKCHHHGLVIPLFSLSTATGLGIGTFHDLKLLIDFCAAIGFDTIQLLPLSDSGSDTSPYNGMSAFALAPIYITLENLPFLSEFRILENLLRRFSRYKPLDRVAYHALLQQKIAFLKEYAYMTRPLFEKDLAYQSFVESNPWLKEYSLYKLFKVKNRKKIWGHWPKIHRDPTRAHIKKMYEKEKFELFRFELTQYLAFKQLSEVKTYANQKKIFLKGDIPILISPESADVWAHREIFDLDFAAGAPPDRFSKTGQYWGFPVYRWDSLFRTDLSWWKSRLSLSSTIYDIFRIDHIIGLYRMWTIPRGRLPSEGSYIPAEKWQALLQGETILKSLLSLTEMLPIGEDLGIDIDHIRASMEKMEIPGTKVLRWERRFENGNEFIPFEEYTPYSLTTVSTHDSETLAGWWELYPDESKDYSAFRGHAWEPTLTDELRFALLRDSHITPSFFHVNLFQEYLSLFSRYRFRAPGDDRVNIPGKLSPVNWTFRYKADLETLLEDDELISTMRSFSESRLPLHN